jgi:hypothetical protein
MGLPPPSPLLRSYVSISRLRFSSDDSMSFWTTRDMAILPRVPTPPLERKRGRGTPPDPGMGLPPPSPLLRSYVSISRLRFSSDDSMSFWTTRDIITSAPILPRIPNGGV